MQVEEIARLMAAYEKSPDVQERQTAFRAGLVEAWGIAAGARVLEIGCGQGDTTAVLADVVGKKGHVTAVDPAGPEYGAPVNLGEATRHLGETKLGKQIEFKLKFDPLDPANAFPDDAFDAVVLAHCSWYFSSIESLQETLQTVKPWAKRLYFSEWDLDPDSMDQLAHWTAVILQSQIEASLPEGQANVRMPLSKRYLTELVETAGWKIERDLILDSSGLDDGRWEIDACLARVAREAKERKLPPRVRKSLENQAEVLKDLVKKHGTRSLPSYGLVARRLEPGEDKPKKSRFSGREDQSQPKKNKPLFDKSLGRENFEGPKGKKGRWAGRE